MASSLPKELQIEYEIENQISQIKTSLERKNYGELKKLEEFLINSFTLSGNIKQISGKIQEIEQIGIDQAVFGTPQCRNLEAAKKLKEIIDGRRI